MRTLKAAWLSTDPRALGAARIKDLSHCVVVAGESAADLHDIGAFHPQRHEFVSPDRRQSQRSILSYRQRRVEPRDVTLVDGLPVMTIERTIADLMDEVGDIGLVANALSDAARTRDLDVERLRALLGPHAQRHGPARNDGHTLLDRLLQDADSP